MAQSIVSQAIGQMKADEKENGKLNWGLVSVQVLRAGDVILEPATLTPWLHVTAILKARAKDYLVIKGLDSKTGQTVQTSRHQFDVLHVLKGGR